MKNVALIFGGRSAEHEVSVITALQILKGYTKEEINLFPLFLSKSNEFFIADKSCILTDFKNPESSKHFTPVYLRVGSPDLFLVSKPKKKAITVDCAVIATHGGIGENGELVAMLKASKIPASSGNCLGVAAGYDKVITKAVAKSINIPTVNGVWFYKQEWENAPTKLISQIKKLKLPVIVKPARQGSSIGITVCHDTREIVKAINLALEFDNKILVENALTNFSEFNCAALGQAGGNILLSGVDEPKKYHEILSFEDKYVGDSKTKGQKASKASGLEAVERKFVTNPKIVAKIKDYTARIMRELGLIGVIRVDYLYDIKRKTIYLNEINTVPGSLAYYFWDKSNICVTDLVDHLIEIAESAAASELVIKEDFITHLF